MKIFTSLNFLALSLTALLLGATVSYYLTSNYFRHQETDKAYVEGLMDQIKKSGGQTVQKSAPASPVQVEEVVFGEAQEISELTGRLVEINRTTVASEVSGRIEKVYVEEGTPVEKGKTMLARVDTVWNKLAVQKSESRLAAFQAMLRYEKSELVRISGLIEDQAVSLSEKESKEAVIQELDAKIAEETTALKEWQLKVVRSEIIAPFRGEVVQRFVDVGSYVNPGTAIAEIISTGEIDARIFVPENVIRRLTVGQKIQVFIEPLNKMIEGKVVTVLSLAAAASRTFAVRVRMSDLDGELKSGMSARAYIPVTDKFPSIIVPENGVLIRPDGATAWLTVEQKKEDTAQLVAEPVPVRILASMPGKFAVRAETPRGEEILVAGANVVTEGAERLAPGMVIQIVKSKFAIEPVPGTYSSGHQKL